MQLRTWINLSARLLDQPNVVTVVIESMQTVGELYVCVFV